MANNITPNIVLFIFFLDFYAFKFAPKPQWHAASFFNLKVEVFR